MAACTMGQLDLLSKGRPDGEQMAWADYLGNASASNSKSHKITTSRTANNQVFIAHFLKLWTLWNSLLLH